MAFGNGPRIVTNGLILHYDFSDTNSYVSGSTTVYDLSGNGNNGTLNGTYFYTSSYKGCIALNCPTIPSSSTPFNDGYIQITNLNADSLGSSLQYSVIGVFRQDYFSDTLSGIAIIYAGAGNGYNSGWRIRTNSNGALSSAITSSMPYAGFTLDMASISGSTAAQSISTNQDPSPFFIGTTVNTLSSVSIYKNNSASASGSLTSPYLSASTVNYIGRKYAGCGSFNGLISCFLIYNRPLSQQEYLQNYNALKSRFSL